MEQTEIRDILNIIIDLLPYLLTGVITYAITSLNNRNNREKAEIRAQEIINQKYVELDADLKKEKEARLIQAASFSEERGGLNARIHNLEEQLKFEKSQRERGAKEQSDITTRLSQQIMDLKITQATVNEKLQEAILERDMIQKMFSDKEAELKRLEEEHRLQYESLMVEVQNLRDKLEAKDQEIQSLKEQLKGKQNGEE